MSNRRSFQMGAQALGGSGRQPTYYKIVQDGAGSTGWIDLDGIEGGDNQDETTRNMLEAAGPLIRMSRLIAQPDELQPNLRKICLW